MPAELAQCEEVHTHQSVAVLRNLMRLAVSNIAYARNLFPEASVRLARPAAIAPLAQPRSPARSSTLLCLFAVLVG
jgi:hypothetical protein